MTIDLPPSGSRAGLETIRKAPSGTYGLDEITGGGLPRGRVSLRSGGPGCGKTLLSTVFLVRGALDHGVCSPDEVESILVRMVDYLKSKGVTLLCTSLSAASDHEAMTQTLISSVMDAWILVRVIDSNGERNRGLYVLKARGIANFEPDTGDANNERRCRARRSISGPGWRVDRNGAFDSGKRGSTQALEREQQKSRHRHEIERKRRLLDARIAALTAEFEADQAEAMQRIEHDDALDLIYRHAQLEMADLRHHSTTETS